MVGEVFHETTKGEINMTDKPDANEAAERLRTLEHRYHEMGGGSHYVGYKGRETPQSDKYELADAYLAQQPTYAEQAAELAELRAKLAKYDDATLVSIEWLESNGIEVSDESRIRYRCYLAKNNQFFNDTFSIPVGTTRGQLLHLLDGLGVRS